MNGPGYYVVDVTDIGQTEPILVTVAILIKGCQLGLLGSFTLIA